MRIDDRSDSGAARGPRRLDLRNRSSARRRETSESRQGASCAGDGAGHVALQSRPLEPSNVAQSASTQIVRAIVRGLYEGEFASGQRLIEPELMTQFDVSRSTVRESIRRMESEGIVTVVPHRGAAIRKMSAAEGLDALMVMQLCVGLAARQAAERIEAHGRRERFEKAWGELEECRHLPDGYDLLLARNRFYRAITEISENHELRRIIPSIQVHLIRRDSQLCDGGCDLFVDANHLLAHQTGNSHKHPHPNRRRSNVCRRESRMERQRRAGTELSDKSRR